jgi:hypothetical protein
MLSGPAGDATVWIACPGFPATRTRKFPGLFSWNSSLEAPPQPVMRRAPATIAKRRTATRPDRFPIDIGASALAQLREHLHMVLPLLLPGHITLCEWTGVSQAFNDALVLDGEQQRLVDARFSEMLPARRYTHRLDVFSA